MSQIKPILRLRRERRLNRIGKMESRVRSSLLTLGMLLSLLAGALILLSALAYASLTKDLPSVEALPRLLNPPNGSLLQPTRVYDRSGQHILATFGVDESPRSYIPLKAENGEQIAAPLPEIFVALADPKFWKHAGYTLSGWEEPALHPTLAQRLVSDLLLFEEAPSLRRAVRERLLAAQVTARFGRSQVLEWHLNSIDFGQSAYGVEAAAQLYFGKSSGELSLAESAILAAVSEGPGLNPLDAPEAATERGREVIKRLLADGLLTTEEASVALSAPIRFQSRPPAGPRPAEAFLNLALSQLETRFNRARLERGGLSIITTLDYDLQQEAACITTLYAARLAGTPDPEGGCEAARWLSSLPPGTAMEDGSAEALILDPVNGQVLALVGETSKGEARPVMTAHDPGSLVTPFIYLTGFTRGLSPASLVWDIPGLVDARNFDGRYHGPVRLRIALANDYRVPAERVRQQMGAENVQKIAASFGFPLDSPLRLLEAAGAYGALGTEGVYYGQEIGDTFIPAAVLRVEGTDGTRWLDWSTPQARPVVSPGLAYLLTNILSDEPSRWASLGSPNPFEIGRPAGVKIGQTQEGQEAWTVGYTPGRVVAAWTGIRTGQVTPRLPGVLWGALMRAASQDQPRDGWALPQGMSVMDVCDPSGLLPGPDCPNIVSEIFLNGSEPTQTDTLFRSYQVNRETGLLATVFTPPQYVEDRVYMIVPPEAEAWAASTGLPSPPDTYDAIQPPAVNPEVNITSPALFASVQGTVRIMGTASGEDLAYYRLQVGQGLNPREWIQVGGDRTVPVEDGLLAEWDTQGLSGLYAVQLTVVRTDQRAESAIIQVTVEGTQ